MKHKIILILFGIMIMGCTTVQRQTVASNEDFVVIQAGENDSYARLAEEFLGDKKFAEILLRYNPQTPLSVGDYVAVPKKSINQSGVFSDGYQSVPILCYHQFTQAQTSNSKMVVTRAEFEAQMAYLAENDYQVITLSELARFLNRQKELPIKSVVITVDDGYRSYYEVAYPILKKYGFHSTMFVYPDFIGAGPALKWRDINYLSQSALVDIQSHSKTHDSLSPSPGGETENDYLTRLKIEVEDAERILTRKTKQTINHFAYPYGNSSTEIVNLLKQNDYQTAVTVHKGSNPAFAAPFLLHRTMIYGGDSLATFKQNLNVFESQGLK